MVLHEKCGPDPRYRRLRAIAPPPSPRPAGVGPAPSQIVPSLPPDRRGGRVAPPTGEAGARTEPGLGFQGPVTGGKCPTPTEILGCPPANAARRWRIPLRHRDQWRRKSQPGGTTSRADDEPTPKFATKLDAYRPRHFRHFTNARTAAKNRHERNTSKQSGAPPQEGRNDRTEAPCTPGRGGAAISHCGGGDGLVCDVRGEGRGDHV